MTSHSELGFVHASEYNRVRHEHGIEGEGKKIAVQVRISFFFFGDSNTDLVVKDGRPFRVRFPFPPLLWTWENHGSKSYLPWTRRPEINVHTYIIRTDTTHNDTYIHA